MELAIRNVEEILLQCTGYEMFVTCTCKMKQLLNHLSVMEELKYVKSHLIAEKLLSDVLGYWNG